LRLPLRLRRLSRSALRGGRQAPTSVNCRSGQRSVRTAPARSRPRPTPFAAEPVVSGRARPAALPHRSRLRERLLERDPMLPLLLSVSSWFFHPIHFSRSTHRMASADPKTSRVSSSSSSEGASQTPGMHSNVCLQRSSSGFHRWMFSSTSATARTPLGCSSSSRVAVPR
jgi:hypothetical protein